MTGPVLFIGPRNAETVIGAPYRWVRDTAARLGVRSVRQGRKSLIPAEAFRAALEAEVVALSTTAPTATDPAEAIRRSLGMRRIGGAK
jgi:hypothetical protein